MGGAYFGYRSKNWLTYCDFFPIFSKMTFEGFKPGSRITRSSAFTTVPNRRILPSLARTVFKPFSSPLGSLRKPYFVVQATKQITTYCASRIEQKIGVARSSVALRCFWR